MENEYCLTPYFLDEPVFELRSLAGKEWHIIQPSLPAGEKQQRLVTLYRPLRDRVADIVRRGNRPVSIAGDCCSSIGVSAGLQKAGITPFLVWLDAHGDFNDWVTSPSGFLGGMPLAMMVGRGEQTIVQGLGMDTLPEQNIILTDARDLDEKEAITLDASLVTRLNDPTALSDYLLPEAPLWIHFDTDIINPEDAPAMNYRAPGGPGVDLLADVFTFLADTGRIMAVSMSTWNPELDDTGRTATACLNLLEKLTGSLFPKENGEKLS